MKIGKITILLGLLVAGAVWVGGDDTPEPSETAAAPHLVNQLWVERWPSDHRDIFGKLVVLRTEHGRFGLVGRSSTWRHLFEAFLWAKEGDELLTAFPQEGHRARFKVRTWPCAGEAPQPFELCLEVRRGDRKAVYYSRQEWEIRPEHPKQDLATITEANPWLGRLELPVSLPAVDLETLPDAPEDWTPFK